MVGIGNIIKKLRKEFNLTQGQLARRLDISPGTLSNYESGLRTPSIDNLIKFAAFFHVSVDYLLGRTNTVDMIDISECEPHEKFLIRSILYWFSMFNHKKNK